MSVSPLVATSGSRRRRMLAAVGVATLGLLAALAARLPAPLLIPAMIVLLAGVDIVAAIAAKSWATNPGVWVFLGGAAVYVLLFWIYAVSLRHGELTTVTVGWVVVVTVASMALDRFRYGVHLSTSKWVAAGLVVILLGYLLMDFGGDDITPKDTVDISTDYGS